MNYSHATDEAEFLARGRDNPASDRADARPCISSCPAANSGTTPSRVRRGRDQYSHPRDSRAPCATADTSAYSCVSPNRPTQVFSLQDTHAIGLSGPEFQSPLHNSLRHGAPEMEQYSGVAPSRSGPGAGEASLDGGRKKYHSQSEQIVRTWHYASTRDG